MNIRYDLRKLDLKSGTIFTIPEAAAREMSAFNVAVRN